MIRVFIGFDEVETVAFHVLSHSIHTRASRPVSIMPIITNQLKSFYEREWDEKQTNAFSFTRFLVPYLCDYEGYAIWMDCDMLCLDDIASLWQLASKNYAVKVVRHTHKPEEKEKYLGRKQSKYRRKNWSSVMLFNCGHIHCKKDDG